MTPSFPSLPLRLYEPNIRHNPFTWMGVWTPQGWRVHEKRFGRAGRRTIRLSGDGKTTFFPEVLRDPDTGRVEWQDDLHLRDDPFTDGGIYPCDPRVEYPAGQPRWQVSHTLMVAPVADHTLFTHEYTWDLAHGHLATHFRKHVALEEARTDARDGRTVRVRHTPISATLEGNVHYPHNNSAVRGVWSNSDRRGHNLYTRRVVQLLVMHNGTYAISQKSPVVQCHGLYYPDRDRLIKDVFDAHTMECLDPDHLQKRMDIPFDNHKLGMIHMGPSCKAVFSRLYEGDIAVLAEMTRRIESADLDDVKRRVGQRYDHGRCGYAAADASHHGYDARCDLNNDGVIDERDVELLAAHVGRTVRFNQYQHAYFGGDWLSTCSPSNPEQAAGDPLIADYEYGGGYDAQTGVIRLLETPGPDRPVWVEYHHDAPAERGEGNIVVHVYRELP